MFLYRKFCLYIESTIYLASPSIYCLLRFYSIFYVFFLNLLSMFALKLSLPFNDKKRRTRSDLLTAACSTHQYVHSKHCYRSKRLDIFDLFRNSLVLFQSTNVNWNSLEIPTIYHMQQLFCAPPLFLESIFYLWNAQSEEGGSFVSNGRVHSKLKC